MADSLHHPPEPLDEALGAQDVRLALLERRRRRQVLQHLVPETRTASRKANISRYTYVCVCSVISFTSDSKSERKPVKICTTGILTIKGFQCENTLFK